MELLPVALWEPDVAEASSLSRLLAQQRLEALRVEGVPSAQGQTEALVVGPSVDWEALQAAFAEQSWVLPALVVRGDEAAPAPANWPTPVISRSACQDPSWGLGTQVLTQVLAWRLRSTELLAATPSLLESVRATGVELRHAINNPLAIIAGNAQLLRELAPSCDLDPDVCNAIGAIEEASQRVAQLVEALGVLHHRVAERHIAQPQPLPSDD